MTLVRVNLHFTLTKLQDTILGRPNGHLAQISNMKYIDSRTHSSCLETELIRKLLFHLNIYPRESDAIAETAKGVVISNRLDYYKLLEEVGTKAVSALVGIVVDEIVVRCLAQQNHHQNLNWYLKTCYLSYLPFLQIHQMNQNHHQNHH